MKASVFCIFLLGITYSHAYSVYSKTIAKRQICSGNNCSPCDGRSCNSCNNNACCSSVNCNQCVSNCCNQCSTTNCKQNCVSGCTTSCQDSSCSSSTCSSCVNRCSQDCSNNNCVNNCARSCDCTNKEGNDSIIIVPGSEGPSVIVNNTNNNLVNLTTHININNVVHNFNNISIPIYVNTTNINNINLSETGGGGNGSTIIRIPEPFPFPVPYPQPQPQPDNCCYLLHPRSCYTDEEDRSRCYIRRTRECSSGLCTSPVVSIEEDSQTTTNGCQRINSWPYYYCGNYVRRDCNDCYTCGGSYNPRSCFRQSGCSTACREAAPNCVPSQNGLQCY